MSKSIYHKEELGDDILFSIATELFEERVAHKLSLDEVCNQTDIGLLELDGMECAMVDIDFAKLAKLLDLYALKLNLQAQDFPSLPSEYGKKYFNQ